MWIPQLSQFPISPYLLATAEEDHELQTGFSRYNLK
jgi:hypothetical protein